jgi:hypothetical protein
VRAATGTLWLALVAVAALALGTRTRRGRVIIEEVTDAAAPVLEEVVVTARRVAMEAARALLPRGIRNNNPGNIRWIPNERARWRGMIGQEGNYGIFDTPANGIRAIGGELRASIRKGQTTVREIINEWAPPFENNTDAYVRAVARALGVQPDQSFNVASRIPDLAIAIIRHENGQQPYNPADVAAWVNS